MLRASNKLLYISSEESDADQGSKNPSQVVRGQSHRFEATGITQGFFNENREEDEDYIIEDRPVPKSRPPIKYIQTREHRSGKGNHSANIGKQKQQQRLEEKKRELIVQHLEDDRDSKQIDLSSIQENKQSRQASESSILKGLNRKNILTVDLQSSSQSSERNGGKIQICRPSPEAIQEVKPGDVFEQDEGNLNLKKQKFAATRLGLSQRLSAIIQRQDSGVNYFVPQLDLVFMEDLTHIMSAKKQVGTKFEYLISTIREGINDHIQQQLGTLLGNFSNSVFSLYPVNNKGTISCTTRFIPEPGIKGAAPRCYEIYLLNQGEDYWALNGINYDKSKSYDLFQLYQANKDKITYYRNRRPEYLKETDSYILNFDGRVSKGSVKNFIIQDSKSGREVMMFGKGKANFFNLYVSSPFSPLIGMAVSIPHFASKLLK